jgi:hypothetical protein
MIDLSTARESVRAYLHIGETLMGAHELANETVSLIPPDVRPSKPFHIRGKAYLLRLLLCPNIS